MKATPEGLTFSTGKTVYANRGIIGICITENKLDNDYLYQGYDGTIGFSEDAPVSLDDEFLTPLECVELADAMLERWQQFRDRWTEVRPDVEGE